VGGEQPGKAGAHVAEGDDADCELCFGHGDGSEMCRGLELRWRRGSMSGTIKQRNHLLPK
jgi:hypothetical protein